jgi:hypothetical protein
VTIDEIDTYANYPIAGHPDAEPCSPEETAEYERTAAATGAVRLYRDGRELTGLDDQPRDLESGDRVLLGLLRGQPAGTTGRLDVLAHPRRRGAHAYRAERCYVVDANGVPQLEAP